MTAAARLHVVALTPLSDADAARIEAVDTRLRLTRAGGWFDDEIRATWPAATVARYLPPVSDDGGRADDRPERSARDALLAEADVVLGGFPFPLDLRRRAPRLRWFHQRPAGASNLQPGDLWNSDVVVTTSRGYGDSSAIAEYAVAGLLTLAKGFPQAFADAAAGRWRHDAYRPLRLAGKTLLVVGAGGIGTEVARLAAALGMRVVGTRRRPPDGPAPAPFEQIVAAERLHQLLGASAAVAVCCQWTPQTTGLFDQRAFAALPDGAMLVNVARGEIIDETALLGALDSGRLRGAVLDVYVGEFEHPPPPRLWSHPRALITPHTSSLSDAGRHRAVELFCDNLRRFLDGEPLRNRVDWRRGY